MIEPTESSLGDYDFLDIGSSKGGSINFARDQLGGKRGLGVDINPANIEHLRGRGYDCLLGDIPYWKDVVGIHRGCRVISGTLPAA